MYSSGQGVVQNNIYAHMWAQLAALNGSKGGIKLKTIIAKQLTLSQLVNAQGLASECVRRHYKSC